MTLTRNLAGIWIARWRNQVIWTGTRDFSAAVQFALGCRTLDVSFDDEVRVFEITK